ncbi:hypothetical protein [Nonomuraea antri]|nr:hypothetical protein [Nonomuraea antri]
MAVNSRPRMSVSRWLLAAIVAWIIVLTVLILLDPDGSAGLP